MISWGRHIPLKNPLNKRRQQKLINFVEMPVGKIWKDHSARTFERIRKIKAKTTEERSFKIKTEARF